MYGARHERQYLFSTQLGGDVLRAQLNAACAEADGLAEQRLLNTDVEALVEYFLNKYSVVVPTLDREGMEGSHHERAYEAYDQWENRPITVPGEAYDFEVPFTGEPAVFKMQPNTFSMNPPSAEVVGNALRFTIAGRALTPEAVQQQVSSLLTSIEQYLDWHRALWAGYPNQLAHAVRASIGNRTSRLLQLKDSAAALAGLGIKIKEKPGDARTFVPPTVKQKILLSFLRCDPQWCLNPH